MTIWVRLAVLAAKLALAWNAAATVWEPAVRVEVERVARPLELRVCWPRTVAPSVKMTTPLGMPLGVVTEAVKVMDAPRAAGEREVMMVVLVTSGSVPGAIVRTPGVLETV